MKVTLRRDKFLKITRPSEDKWKIVVVIEIEINRSFTGSMPKAEVQVV